MTDPNSFLMGGSTNSAKFEHVGANVTGTIDSPPEVQQQRDFSTQKPKFWDDGNPMQQLKVVLATTQRDPANAEDDGKRAVYIKGQMRSAVADAVKKAGAKGLEVGGTLTVTYVGDGEAKRGQNAPKNYSATYAAPNVSGEFLGQNAQAAAQHVATTPAAPPVQQQAAPPVVGGLTAEQIASLKANGFDTSNLQATA